MAIKKGSKINPSFSAASMTDLIFLLLLFMTLAATLANPHALNLTLPQSSNKTDERPMTTVSIDADLNYSIETTLIPFVDLETGLIESLRGIEDPIISLFCDRTVPIDEVVKVMNIARKHQYKLILATRPE